MACATEEPLIDGTSRERTSGAPDDRADGATERIADGSADGLKNERCHGVLAIAEEGSETGKGKGACNAAPPCGADRDFANAGTVVGVDHRALRCCNAEMFGG
jgi:hypothetical protein